MISDQSLCFPQSLSVIEHYTSIFTSCTERKQVFVLPPCLSVMNPDKLLQNWITERELANKDECAETKRNKTKQKIIIVEVKLDVIRTCEKGDRRA